jgi:hypothetical protein
MTTSNASKNMLVQRKALVEYLIRPLKMVGLEILTQPANLWYRSISKYMVMNFRDFELPRISHKPDLQRGY